MSHATAPVPVLPFTSSLLSCTVQSFGAAPMVTAVLYHASQIWTRLFDYLIIYKFLKKVMKKLLAQQLNPYKHFIIL